jgi:type IV pilus assembly protein PilO
MRFGLREVLFLIILVAVPAASLFYVFRPHNIRIERQLGEIQRKETELVQLHEVLSQVDDLDRAIAEGRELISMIEGKLPTEQNVDEILDQVWQVTVGNGLAVKSVKASKVEDEGLYRELPLEMVVEGSFDGFYRFLLELENLPRITRIHEMQLERLKTQSSSAAMFGQMKAVFTLSIYFQPRSGLQVFAAEQGS